MESYLTAAGYGEAEYIDKKSRFIGRVWPVEDESEALALLAETRKRFADATHNVYAYTLRESGVMRYSDDGEPGGTSGQPTLSVLRSRGVENVLCVTTRYFGGILLGSGGLVRAYSNAARMALDAAGTAEMASWRSLRLELAYGWYDRARLLLEEFRAVTENTDFAAAVTVSALLREDRAEEFQRRLTDMTNGAALCEKGGVEFRGAKI